MPLTPKQASDDTIRRSRNVLQHSKKGGLTVALAADLVRAALVMGIAALDTYMHVAVLRKLAGERPDLPKALRKMEVCFEDLCGLVECELDARRDGRVSRPWVRVKGVLHAALLKQTFQSYDEVGTAMSMCGVDKAWTQVAKALGCSCNDVKVRLNSIVHRRNQIVHESDLERSARPHDVKHNYIEVSEVEQDVVWLERLLASIDGVVKP